ncbi:MAG: hypothetical protein AB1538_07735 [Bacillota bacterium]
MYLYIFTHSDHCLLLPVFDLVNQTDPKAALLFKMPPAGFVGRGFCLHPANLSNGEFSLTSLSSLDGRFEQWTSLW